jgi:SAM-dependent methyltransferase
MDQLKLIGRPDEIAIMVESIRAVAPVDRPLQILEAGCGQKWELDLEGVRYALTGVDLDPAALKIRIEMQKDLDDGIVGDLRCVSLPENSFDVIYSYYVLEHIRNAEAVLRNFLNWLRPGGIAIIKIPDPHSVHGFLTRKTPHWFHVFFYRFVLRNKKAGTPGHGPYPTYYNPVVSRSGMRKFCSDNGVALVEFGDASEYADKLVDYIARLVGTLAFGKLSTRHSDLLYIVRKP